MKPSIGTMMAVLSNISMILALAMLSVVLRSVEAFSDGAITSFYLSLLLGVVLSAVLMTVFHDRVGPGVLGIAGSLCLMYVSYQWLSVEQGTTLWSLGWRLVILGTGGGLTMASGLVGAALGGPMSQLPKTMTAVQFVRLLIFMMIAPLFSWTLSTTATANFEVLSWNISITNVQFIQKLNTIVTRLEGYGLHPHAAKQRALALIANELHTHAVVDTTHFIFAMSLWAAGALLVFSIAMAISGKGATLRQRPEKETATKTEPSLTPNMQISNRQLEL
ncbi:hypothetical protein [Alicyclobacillus sp. ALC3]|uniref:hypothetical protein n=1 Tax=Alicyclobacillus sp. ALC3 TaxID=2796143 RepID=UPI0023785ADD|nr:hypothetical protein [Alicyclobacillus sp. ALC3]WDL96798.1 hypothetical protein JC200_21300 [Alicyclobacillus sp. ALC3]